MTTARADLADLGYFLAIARHRSFRMAGDELGVSASAVSHSLKGLEARYGVRLVDRTSRSVALTGAGEDLQRSIERPYEEMMSGIAAFVRRRSGETEALTVEADAEAGALLVAPIMGELVRRHPGIEMRIVAPGERTDERWSPDVRIERGNDDEADVGTSSRSSIETIVAAAPSYFSRQGSPADPCDLEGHRRLATSSEVEDERIWSFDGPDGLIRVAAPPATMVHDEGLMLAMALAGAGLIRRARPTLAAHLAVGTLVPALERWSAIRNGYHLSTPVGEPRSAEARSLIELLERRLREPSNAHSP